MELITKKMHMLERKCQAVSQITFDEDILVCLVCMRNENGLYKMVFAPAGWCINHFSCLGEALLLI